MLVDPGVFLYTSPIMDSPAIFSDADYKGVLHHLRTQGGPLGSIFNHSQNSVVAIGSLGIERL